MSEIEKERNAPEEDHLLVRAHLRNDPEGFRLLYEKYKDKVFATAYRIMGETHAASDLTQEIFLKIHRELRTFKFESKFSTWLFRVAVNHAINKANEVRRHTRIQERIAKEGRSPGGPRLGSLDEGIQRAIQGLSPKLRAIVSLRYLEGLAYHEIAELLEISLGTVKSRLFLAHETLRPLLRQLREERPS